MYLSQSGSTFVKKHLADQINMATFSLLKRVCTLYLVLVPFFNVLYAVQIKLFEKTSKTRLIIW